MEHIERTSYRPFAVGENLSVLKTVKRVNAETNDIESRRLQREIALLENICLQDAIDTAVSGLPTIDNDGNQVRSDVNRFPDSKPTKPNLLDIEYRFNGEAVYLV